VLDLFKGKLTYASVAALAAQALAAVFGIDIAPGEVEAVLIAATAAVAVFARWRATHDA
jgi:hypothetical protein